MDVCLIENFRALGLGKDEVEEEGQADPGVKRDPVVKY